MSDCCVAITKEGRRCRNKLGPWPQMYCHSHDRAAVREASEVRRRTLDRQVYERGRCTATLKSGERCTRPIAVYDQETGLCGIHQWFVGL